LFGNAICIGMFLLANREWLTSRGAIPRSIAIPLTLLELYPLHVSCNEVSSISKGTLLMRAVWPVPLWRLSSLPPALPTTTSFRSQPRSDAELLRNDQRRRVSVW